jgi:rhodanese-related sulfurtransferase
MAARRILKELILVTLVAASLAFIVNALSPRGIALFGEWDKEKGLVSAKPKSDSVGKKAEIETNEAIALYGQGVLFVDARSKEDFAQGHIKDAVSLSAENFEELIGPFSKQYPETAAIVAYCSGRECSDSHDLAESLMNAGYSNVRIFIDGYPAWEARGLPVEKNP